jgi:putative hemolysin
MPFGAELVVILLMLILNALFAAFEIGLASVARLRLLALVQSGCRGARDALFMKEYMESHP